MPVKPDERQALEAFITSEDLVRLETRFARFNVFEALGVARRELQHSSFLAFLLDPRESHGLGEMFLRRFLQEITRLAAEPTVSIIDLDGFDLSRTEVRREYENIDIFLRDPTHKILVVIENKVGSKQHDDQLRRYAELVTKRFPGHRFIGVYLTPDGDDAIDTHYVAATYEMVRTLVKELLDRDTVLIPAGFRTIFQQYADLLGRRFMADHELQELCARIYKRHKLAIDILQENIPDDYARALETVKVLVAKSGYHIEFADNHRVRFIPPEFKLAAFQSQSALLPSGQMVYAECKKKNDSLVFQVKMDGGSAKERSLVHTFAAAHKPFRPDKSVYTKYQVLYKRLLLEGSELDQSEKELEVKLKSEWEKFVDTDLAVMRKACADAAILWVK